MRSGSVGTANAYRKAGDVVRSHVVVRYVTDADRGLLPKKKQKKKEKMLTEEEFRTEVADTLGAIAVDTARFARAAELQNFLLQQLVVVLGGSGTAFSKLPEEGKLETEDKADKSYKAVMSPSPV